MCELQFTLPINYKTNRKLRRRLSNTLYAMGFCFRDIGSVIGVDGVTVSRDVKSTEDKSDLISCEVIENITVTIMPQLEEITKRREQARELRKQIKQLTQCNQKLERKLSYLRRTGKQPKLGKYKRLFRRNQRLEFRVKSLRLEVALLNRRLERWQGKPKPVQKPRLPSSNGTPIKICICGGHMKVKNSRERSGYIYRRRECNICGRRITTQEFEKV